MNKDQNLIFEAYAETLTESWEAGAPVKRTHSESEEYDNDELMVNGVEYIVQAEISGDDVEITTLFKYDAELDDHIEVDLDSISPQLRQDIEDSVQNDAGRENNLQNTPLEELSTLTPAEYEIAKTMETFDDDDWYESKRQKLFFRKREGGEDNEDFGNTDYDVDEPSVFERLEELMNSKPELEGVLKPILLEFEDALMEIDKIDNNNFDPQEVFTSLARLYPF